MHDFILKHSWSAVFFQPCIYLIRLNIGSKSKCNNPFTLSRGGLCQCHVKLNKIESPDNL